MSRTARNVLGTPMASCCTGFLPRLANEPSAPGLPVPGAMPACGAVAACLVYKKSWKNEFNRLGISARPGATASINRHQSGVPD